jgi:pseudouridine synthase
MSRRAEPTAEGTIPPELTDASRGQRLQKVLARAGVASRRDCESFIAEGRVSVNGQPVTGLPAWVDPDRDRIRVDGKPVKGLPGKIDREPTCLALHKPRRVISTTDDPEGRPSVTELVDPRIRARLFPVGRLDADSTGLMLLTDDGELANRITHPRYGLAKEYLVSVRGQVTDEDAAKLQQGLMLTDQAGHASAGRVKRAAVEQVRVVRRQRDRQRGDRTLLAITLREGQNREIRRLLARRDVKVKRLKRVAIGPLRLKRLPVGQWRYLTPHELTNLRKAAGLPQRAGKSH